MQNKIIARKAIYRILTPSTTAASKLVPIKAIRKLTDRSKFQYQIIFSDGSIKEFLNFKQLTWYANTKLRNQTKYLIINRGDNVTESSGFIC